MRKGQFYINGVDAYEEFGIFLAPSARATLMTPVGLKDPIKSSSRNEHGSRYVVNPQVEERDITLNITMTAHSADEFLERYAKFCRVLEGGSLKLYVPKIGRYFHTIYRSCNQYQEWCLGIAKFALRLTEPNPTRTTE